MEMNAMINNQMSAAESAKLRSFVETYNKSLSEGKAAQNALDKDDFLKILITQLQNQDPTAPMEDKEFIAQMAQFSSLEQMTNMSENFSRMASMISGGEALASLGMAVDVQTQAGVESGIVEEVLRGETPQVRMNGKLYDYDDVLAVRGVYANAAYESANAAYESANAAYASGVDTE